MKQVTVACENVFGYEARYGFIRARAANRLMMPKNNTKKDLARMIGSLFSSRLFLTYINNIIVQTDIGHTEDCCIRSLINFL